MRILRRISWVLLCSLMVCVCSSRQRTHVLIRTEWGGIRVELYGEEAPITVSNFLRYVDGNRFKGSFFYRVVRMDNQPNDSIKIEVIQGGLYDEERMLTPIAHETTAETGILHRDGTISMARSEPGTATSEFFICVGDQPELDFGGKRNPDGQGFAAFGRVVDGMEVVKQIRGQPVDGQMLNPRIQVLDIVRLE